MAEVRNGDYIRTYSGGKFFPLDPRAKEIRVTDIAHALSNLCRFTGHCRTFYSVAEHSVWVSRVCAPQDAMWGLMHDASEAYLCDIARPVKHSPAMAEYRAAEDNVMGVVCERFKLPAAMPDSVAEADEVLLYTEKRDLFSVVKERWRGEIPAAPYLDLRQPMSPAQAKEAFLIRYAEIKAQTLYARQISIDRKVQHG